MCICAATINPGVFDPGPRRCVGNAKSRPSVVRPDATSLAALMPPARRLLSPAGDGTRVLTTVRVDAVDARGAGVLAATSDLTGDGIDRLGGEVLVAYS